MLGAAGGGGQRSARKHAVRRADAACAVCRMMREYQEMEQALAGDKDDNPWAWVRKRLIGVRGYKPWFGHLFTKDQQEMRYRDIHADLRTVREQIEKESKDRLKETKGASGAGAAPGNKGKGSMEKLLPAYAEMDPMRRAHLFGVSIQAHVVPPWARQDGEEIARTAADPASSSGNACGGGLSLVKRAGHAGSAEGGAQSKGDASVVSKGAKKRKPGTQKQAGSGDGKVQKVGANGGKGGGSSGAGVSGKGNRSTRDRAWIRLRDRVVFALVHSAVSASARCTHPPTRFHALTITLLTPSLERA